MNPKSEDKKSVWFPEAGPVGTLYNLGTWSDVSLETLEAPAEAIDARGEILLPKNALLKLRVSPEASEDLSFFRELRPNDLTWLDLSETRVSDRQLQHLEKLSGLSGLILNRTGTTDDGLSFLLALPELEHLDLRETKVGDGGTISLGRSSKLHSLDLSSTLITDDALRNLEPLSELTSLNLNHTGITDLEIERLCSLTSLVVLGLEGMKIDHNRLTRLGCLKHLRVLLLGHSNVTDQSLELLEDLPELEELGLQCTKITEGAAIQLSRCNSLQLLHAEGCQIPSSVWHDLTRERSGLTVHF